MGEVSLKLSKKEARLLRKCAKWNNTDISTVVQHAVLKRIEEEYDLNLFKDQTRGQGPVWSSFSHRRS